MYSVGIDASSFPIAALSGFASIDRVRNRVKRYNGKMKRRMKHSNLLR